MDPLVGEQDRVDRRAAHRQPLPGDAEDGYYPSDQGGRVKAPSHQVTKSPGHLVTKSPGQRVSGSAGNRVAVSLLHWDAVEEGFILRLQYCFAKFILSAEFYQVDSAGELSY